MALANKVVSRAREAIGELTKQHHDLNKAIDAQLAQLQCIELLACSPAEALEVVNRQIGEAADRWEQRFMRGIPIDPKTLQALPEVHGPMSGLHIQEVIDFQAFMYREMSCTGYQKLTSSAEYPKSISQADRIEQVKACTEKIETLQTALEEICLAMEELGANVDRRADLMPSVFLEFQSPTNFRMDRLKTLKDEIGGLRLNDHKNSQEHHDHSQELASEQRKAFDLRRHGQTDALKETDKRIGDLGEKRKVLLEKRNAIDGRIRLKSALLNACLQFLKSKGVEIDERHL